MVLAQRYKDSSDTKRISIIFMNLICRRSARSFTARLSRRFDGCQVRNLSNYETKKDDVISNSHL